MAIIGGSVADVLGGEKAPNGQCLLEFELDSILGTNNIEVIGAGTSGYVVEQEFIETQLILQKYKPDFILGLHGYNDLMTFKLNRYINDQILLPPQNYRDFLVIEQGKERSKFISRFTYLFKNTCRAFDFIKRYFNKQSAYDYTSVNEETYEMYSDQYIDIVNDINDFCKSKNIKYYDFLQPVKYYNNTKENYLINNDEVPEMAKMYSYFENKQTKLTFSSSLTHLLDSNSELYIDNCHLLYNGNRILAHQIAIKIAEYIKQDPKFIK